MTLLVTGGAGFIGSAVCRYLVGVQGQRVVNLDALKYAASLSSLAEVADDPGYRFVHADIRDRAAVADVLRAERPRAVLNLAAETHVDRSIDGPDAFVDTNVVGTMQLLEAVRAYWSELDRDARTAFRFLQVSTDEVYGSLDPDAPAFTETHRYRPNSPYAASKASADHLVSAWHHTYGLPAIVTNCSNNYGPYQFPEKLIPLMIINALRGRELPIYGTGENVRDWLYVEDHARALWMVLEHGVPGGVYNIGGRCERSNIEVVRRICDHLDRMVPADRAYREQIAFVADRPGHDARYAMNIDKIGAELGWTPAESFDSGLAKTVAWYLDRRDWWEPLIAERYDGRRLGLAGGRS